MPVVPVDLHDRDIASLGELSVAIHLAKRQKCLSLRVPVTCDECSGAAVTIKATSQTVKAYLREASPKSAWRGGFREREVDRKDNLGQKLMSEGLLHFSSATEK